MMQSRVQIALTVTLRDHAWTWASPNGESHLENEAGQPCPSRELKNVGFT